MMTSDFIIDVSEADFEYEVIAYSQQVPVLVDFWAEWCGPCKVLGPVLERLAEEARGGFRLARVNVDENPNLAHHYQVRGIPAVKAFREGRMVAEFTGVQPEPKVREFIRSLVPNEADLMLEKALGWYDLGEFPKAEDAFRDVLDIEPENSKALLGLAHCLLRRGEGIEARYILDNFPASKEYTLAEKLKPLAKGLSDAADPAISDEPLEAAYGNALRLVKRGNLEAALDGLLDILRQNKRFRHGEAQQSVLGLLDLLGEGNPLTKQYRSELASIMF